MGNQFFLSYEVRDSYKIYQGYILFTSDAKSPEEIAKVLDSQLDKVKDNIMANETQEVKVMPISFNRV